MESFLEGLGAPSRVAPRALVALLLAVFCFSGVFDHALWTPQDSREGGMVADMYRTGHWSVLTLNGQPFLEKPPLLHWAALTLCRLAGRVEPGLVRLPAALFGFATMLIVWAWGVRLGRERAGILAALLLATNITFFEYSRIVLTDICLTFTIVLALSAFWIAFDAARVSLLRWTSFLLLTALSFYAKGLVGPVFVMSSVVVFLAWKRRFKTALAVSLAFVPILVLIVVPWAAALYRAGGREYLISVFIDNQLGRFFALPTGAAITELPFVGRWLSFMADRSVPWDPYFVHKEPIYHYLVKLPVRLLPWTLLLPPAAWHWIKRRGAAGHSLATFLGCAALTMLVYLHVASSKCGVYALPVFPIFFLMIGVWCEDKGGSALAGVEAGMTFLTSILVRAATFALPGFYLLLFALPAAVFAKLPWKDLSSFVWLPGAVHAWMGAAACVVALVLAFWSLRIASARFDEQDHAGGVLVLAATMAIVVVVAGAAFMPAYDRQRSIEPIAELAREELAHGRRVALSAPEQQIVGLFVFYTGRPIPVIEPVPGVRRFLDASATPSVVIVRRTQLPDVERSLAGVDYHVAEPPADAGMNAREFCVIERSSASQGQSVEGARGAPAESMP